MSEGRPRRSPDRRSPTARVFDRLRADRTRGALSLSSEALGILADLVNAWSGLSDTEARRAMRSTARSLEAAQPAMGSFLRWSTDLRRMARSHTLRGPAAQAESWFRKERSRLRAERAGLVRTSHERLQRAVRIVTLSRSRSVLWALEGRKGCRRPVLVSVLESLPGGEGRVFAKELRGRGVPARVIRDRQGIREGAAADLLLVGADAVFSDGSLEHKVGTRALARAAFRAGVPVVVVAGRSKFALRPPPHRKLPAIFDRTPSRYISEIWTDRGMLRGGAPLARRTRRTSL